MLPHVSIIYRQRSQMRVQFKLDVVEVALAAVVLALLMLAAPATQAWPDHQASGSARAISGSNSSPQHYAAAAGDTADAFYVSEVDPGVQRECLICHKAGGSAPQSGARLILSGSAEANHGAFSEFVSLENVDGDWVLAKVEGRLDHGGGAVLSQSAALYGALQEYLSLLGEGSSSDGGTVSFWEGTAAEPRVVTLRRAALLFGGLIPDEEAIGLATESERGLRQAISSTLTGPGFKEFILRGANDRLLVEGLLNGINFDIDTRNRYPELADLLKTLPERRPEQFDDYHDKPFLTRGDADWTFRWAITREPLEIIAHVIINDLPYRQVLTANHTMVNAFSDLAYRSMSGLSHNYADEQGFYDRSQFNHFVPGYNDGAIPHDEKYEANEEQGIVSFSNYQEWPHAGILSTQGWLARYPSTDTNRNRARARWTYLHFLGVDIERSAPRTTDPIALADNDNPTMKNSACTVCHERLDPVAGAYQSFGDLGHYLDQFGGNDSLADSYKCPECYGGEFGDTLYEQGDTWYRDMRAPGFAGKAAGGARDSLQWLGYRVSRDPRFAAATVRFWWPAIFGTDPIEMPEDERLPDYESQMRAYNEQDSLVSELANNFEASGFNAKKLFVDMVMSPWYRHSKVVDPVLANTKAVELATVGRGRLLGPEELDRKNLALFGRTWRQWRSGADPHQFSMRTALTGPQADYKGFYGGIDGATVTARNREFTALMSNLTESMATDLACQIVVQDFNRPQGERKLFTLVDRTSVPGQLLNIEKKLPGKVSDMDQLKTHAIRGQFAAAGGSVRFKVADLTRDAHRSVDDEWSAAALTVKTIVIRQGGRVVKTLSGSGLQYNAGFRVDVHTDDSGRKHRRGDPEPGVGWRMHGGAWVEFTTRLAPGEYQLEAELGTSLLSNNVNDAMSARIVISATENVDETDSGRLFRQQIATLLEQALARPASDATVAQLMGVLMESAGDATDRGDWFFDQDSHCDTWSIWPGEELTDEENRVRYGDSEGMMRGWATLLHGVMTSWEYLHD